MSNYYYYFYFFGFLYQFNLMLRYGRHEIVEQETVTRFVKRC